MIWRLVIISDGVKDTDGNAKDISHEAKTKAMDLTPKAKTKDIQHKHKSLCHGDLSLWRDVMPESLCLHTRLVTKTHHYRCYVSAGWERTGQYLFIILMSSFPSPPSLPSLPSPFPALLPTPHPFLPFPSHLSYLLCCHSLPFPGLFFCTFLSSNPARVWEHCSLPSGVQDGAGAFVESRKHIWWQQYCLFSVCNRMLQ